MEAERQGHKSLLVTKTFQGRAAIVRPHLMNTLPVLSLSTVISGFHRRYPSLNHNRLVLLPVDWCVL